MVRLPCVGLLLAVVAVAQAPPGYKTYENKNQRVIFYYPTAYEEVPLPPTEMVGVAKFVMKTTPRELKKVDDRLLRAVDPQLQVFCFALPAAITGVPSEPAAGTEKPSTLRDMMEAQNRVTSWPQFVDRFKAWSLTPDAKDPDHFVMRYSGQSPVKDMAIVGHLRRKQEGGAIFGVYGYTLAPHEATLEKQVEKVAKSLQLADDDSGAMEQAAIDRLYASGKYHDVDGRKQARLALARGWHAVDTENFLIVHHSKNEGLIRRIARDIEAMRATYMELFPPTAPVDRLSIVRVCRTMDEYFQYGGPPNTGGYWHPGNEELVFYDYSYTMTVMDEEQRKALGGRKFSSDDSLLVLYHEAFHQYIHYAIGEFSPHDWFNEGYGDYFSGAVVGDSTGHVLRIDPSPWRIHMAKDMCEFGKGFIPLREILEAERPVFYNRARIGFFYAGAWSFVYFLKNSKEVAADPKWSKLLAVYFDAIKQSYAAELTKLGDNPDLGKKQVAAFTARRVALAKMLDGVDVPKLEATWKQWVIDMKDPWPSQRKKAK